MSSAQQILDSLTPWGNAAKDGAQELLHRYGLGAMFAANVLGAGSVYILSQTGASVGFSLLWVLPLAFGLDMVMHDMSSRMAVRDKPLMEWIRNELIIKLGRNWGHRLSVWFALTMALVMQLWAVANYAVAGAAMSWFTGVNLYLCIGVVGFIGIGLVQTHTYNKIEAVISGLLVLVFVSYGALNFGLDVPMKEVVAGFDPRGINDATLVIAMLGTTVYYPNFFIQSSMRPTKEWTSLKKYRRDNMVGIAFSVLVSAGMLTVAAVALSPGELTLTDPAQPLVDMVGQWTLPVFMVAVLAASFTSATGTLFGSGFAVPQAEGYKTKFNDKRFTDVVVGLIAISLGLSVTLLAYTEMTPVRMAITMPAVNGAIFLPLTILAMFAATHDEMAMWQKVITGVAVIVMFAGSLMTIESLINTVVNWL